MRPHYPFAGDRGALHLADQYRGISVSTVVPLLLRCFLAVFSIERRAHARFSAAMTGRSLIISCRNSKNSGKRLIEASSFGSAPRRSALVRRHYPLHEAVHRRRVGPAQHRDDAAIGVDPGQIAAGAASEVAPGGGARIESAPGVQPPEVPVLGVERAGLEHPL